jgi:uncharacterized protein (TIGR02266 family)
MVRISTAERFRAAYLRDLSEGGLFIKTDRPLPLGREVVIDLLPPGFTVPLRLAATVVRQGEPNAPGMGVRFGELEVSIKEALRALISSYEQAAVAPSVPAQAPVSTNRDLEALLEQYAILKNDLEARDKELATERGRHDEASHRAVKLADELEALRNHTEREPGAAPDEIHTALGEKEVELTEARMRISELEGDLEAYRSEVQVLEEDDANSRRLAATLAQEKLALIEESERLTAELEAERHVAQERLRDLETQLQASDSEAKEIIHSMQSDLDARQMTAAQQGTKAATLEAQVKEHAARQATFDTELKALRLENVSLTARVSQSDKALKDANERIEKARRTERELRELLSSVSSRPAAPAPAARAAPPQTEVTIDLDEPADALPPAAALRPADEFPDFDVQEDLDAPLSLPPPPPPPPPPRIGGSQTLTAPEFEKRLRANAELKKTPTFDDHVCNDDAMNKVKGLLEAGERLTELMVLGRGLVTPPQLLEVLFKLHVAGVIVFR